MGKYCYDYARPALTADCVVFGQEDEKLYILLIQRKYDPFKDMWAFPGGFVEADETVEQAAERELLEETGLKGIILKQFHTFSNLNRDPRGWTISVAFLGTVNKSNIKINAGDDARLVQWFLLEELPSLAFDHDEILSFAMNRLRGT